MLTLDDRTFLTPRLKSLRIPLSEYSFANLFLFRKKHHYKKVHFESEVFIQGKTTNGTDILIPTAVLESNSAMKVLERGFTLYPIPKEWLKIFSKECRITNMEEDNDYLFKQEKIALYPGRTLSSKRNLVSQLERDTKVDIAPLTKTNKLDAFKVLEVWVNTSGNSEDDRLECQEALEFLEELSLTGLIFYTEKKPIAFLIIEGLCDSVHIVHFAKGLKNYKGIYPYIYQQFAKRLEQDSWLNFEQDLGLPNLRQTKHSFHPDAYGVKHRVSLKIAGN